MEFIDGQNLARLFDAALDAVIGMNREGRVVAWNKQAEETFGWSQSEAIDSLLADLIVPEDLRAAHAKGLLKYLETGEAVVLNQRVEVEGQTKTGRRFPVELTVVPVGTPGNEMFFAFLRDITSRREHEESLRQRALQAEVLWEATELVAAGGTPDDLFKACLERICRVTEWQVGHVYLPDNVYDPRQLLPSEVWHFEDSRFAPLAQETMRFICARGEGLPGMIWSSGEPKWIPDISESNNLPRKHIWLKQGLNAAFGFPVFGQNRLQVVLEFFSTSRQAPDQQLLYVVQGLGQQLGRVLERQRAQEEQAMLLREMRHRMGNTLAVLQAVFRMSAKHATTVEDLRNAFDGRIMNMAAAHAILAEGNWQAADLRELVKVAVEPFCSVSEENCSLPASGLRLPVQLVMPITMVLHELATNAAKHGAFSTSAGKLEIDWREEADGSERSRLVIEWRERGVGQVAQNNTVGYGSSLIDNTVMRSLGGKVLREYGNDGLTVRIAVPMK